MRRRGDLRQSLLRKIVSALLNLRADVDGGAMMTFGLSLAPLLFLVNGALDYAAMARQKAQLQASADLAALDAAKELRMVQTASTPAAAAAMVQGYAANATPALAATIPGANLVATPIASNTAVQVVASAVYRSRFFNQAIPLNAVAVARAAGYPMCALALDPTMSGSLYAATQSQITAPACMVQANSTASDALDARGTSGMTAGAICSSGGHKGHNFTPAPVDDCPPAADPIAGRPPPPIGPCVANSPVTVHGGTVALYPGNYCGGLHVTGGAIVTLTPGEYIVSDGPLLVGGGASLLTSSAGIYLTGTGATIEFHADSTINMTAPTNGPLAGLMIYEDPNVSSGQRHNIHSNNAPNLHGTIYLPVNELYIDANASVAQASTFTIIISRHLHVDKAANLVLNSDYGASSVPLPPGIGPGYPMLVQ